MMRYKHRLGVDSEGLCGRLGASWDVLKVLRNLIFVSISFWMFGGLGDLREPVRIISANIIFLQQFSCKTVEEYIELICTES